MSEDDKFIARLDEARGRIATFSARTRAGDASPNDWVGVLNTFLEVLDFVQEHYVFQREEMARLALAAAEFDKAANLYRDAAADMRTAIGEEPAERGESDEKEGQADD
jgi:hypothetical protein